MSEIKGQLLGVLIVLGIFAAVGTLLVDAFKQQAKDIAAQMEKTVMVVAYQNASSPIVAPSGNIYAI